MGIKQFLCAGAAVCAAVGVPLLLLKPGRAAPEKAAPFVGRSFAHRGLHSFDRAVPENSPAAFRRAVEAGYGIELDVQLTRDGEVVVFHDETLERVCGVPRRVDELRWNDLRKLPLYGTAERIPSFSDVLALAGERAPLIVELKSGPRNGELCEKTRALLDGFPGDACVESFDPRIVAWFRFHAPEYLRGQLAMPPEDYRPETCSAPVAFLLGNTFFNALSKPEFIAYRIGPRPLGARLAERMGAVKVGWTARDPREERDLDAVIFEYYRPAARLRRPDQP